MIKISSNQRYNFSLSFSLFFSLSLTLSYPLCLSIFLSLSHTHTHNRSQSLLFPFFLSLDGVVTASCASQIFRNAFARNQETNSKQFLRVVQLCIGEKRSGALSAIVKVRYLIWCSRSSFSLPPCLLYHLSSLLHPSFLCFKLYLYSFSWTFVSSLHLYQVPFLVFSMMNQSTSPHLTSPHQSYLCPSANKFRFLPVFFCRPSFILINIMKRDASFLLDNRWHDII